MAKKIDSIKVAIITTVPETLWFFVGFISFLKTKGFEVHCLSSPGEKIAAFAEHEKVKIHMVEMPRRITPVRDCLAIVQLAWKLLRIGPQIVHAHTPKGGLLGMICGVLTMRKIRIYHIHGLPLMTATGYKNVLLRWSEKISSSLAHQVLCVSKSICDVAVNEGLCSPKKIGVVRNGSINGVDAIKRFNPHNIDDDFVLKVYSKFRIPQDSLVIGFVGRIVHDKGLFELVAAWEQLRKDFKSLHLMVVGKFESGDPVLPKVKEVLIRDPRIHLTGFINEIAPLYKVMDVVVLPSYREGFPVSLLEAAAMAKPVVATKIAGCVDAVKDGVTGILVPPYNSEALKNAIKLYLCDPLLRHKHGRAARLRVLSNYRQDLMWEAMQDIYLSLLRGKSLVKFRA